MEIPMKLQKLVDHLDDFKFNEEVDFNEADTRYFNERYKNKTMAELVFSPTFSMLGA